VSILGETKRRNLQVQSDLEETVLARERVLLGILEGRLDICRQVMSGIDSTTTFASWEWRSHGIVKLARGTLRKFANQALGRRSAGAEMTGWRYLDDLRKAVKRLIEVHHSPRSKAAKAIKENSKLVEKSSLIKDLEVSMLRQSRAYLNLLQQVRGLANSGSVQVGTRTRLFNILNSHDELFGDLFGPEIIHSLRPDNVEVFKR